MPSERPYEVIISGSGPAGAGLALALTAREPSLAGRILVLEAGRHPREKICAGGVTADGVRQLAAWGAPLSVPAVPIKGVRLRFGDRWSDIEAPHSGAVVVRRDVFDAALVAEARRRGVEVRERTPVVDLLRRDDGVEVKIPEGSLRARCVVGADGVAGAVRRALRFPQGKRHVRLLVAETFDQPAPAGEPGLFAFDFSCVPRGVQGYVWDFPCVIGGRRAMSRGIFDRAPDGVRRRDWKAEFARALEERKVAPQSVRWKGYPERSFDPRLPIAVPRALLVGDAAGIDPLMGEGIAQSFIYAELAADTLLRARRRDDYRFLDYQSRVLRSPLGRELRLTARTADTLYSPRHFPFWISLLFESTTVRRVVGEALAEGGGLSSRLGRIGFAALGRLLTRTWEKRGQA